MGSNLPPGVTAADIDRNFGGGHDHEFAGAPDREVFEDGAFILIDNCEYVTAPRARHNQTCDVERQTRLDASRLEVTDRRSNEWHTVATSDDNVFHDAYADDVTFGYGVPRDCELYVTDSLCDKKGEVVRNGADGVTVECDYHERVVTIDGTRYTELPERQIRITYDNVSEDIRQ